MPVRSQRLLRRTPQQQAEFQRRLDAMLEEMLVEMWLEQIAWLMYGIDFEQFDDETIIRGFHGYTFARQL